jgi:hypothetical protein
MKIPCGKAPGVKVPSLKVPGMKVPSLKVPGVKVPGKVFVFLGGDSSSHELHHYPWLFFHSVRKSLLEYRHILIGQGRSSPIFVLELVFHPH